MQQQSNITYLGKHFEEYLNSNSDTRVKSGRPTVLTTNEEEEITQAIMLMVEWGIGGCRPGPTRAWPG